MAVVCIIGCLATLLGSNQEMSGGSPTPSLKTQKVSCHCQMSLEREQISPQLRITDLKQLIQLLTKTNYLISLLVRGQ